MAGIWCRFLYQKVRMSSSKLHEGHVLFGGPRVWEVEDEHSLNPSSSWSVHCPFGLTLWEVCLELITSSCVFTYHVYLGIIMSFFKRKWRMDLSYLVNMCLFSLNSLIVTSLPGGSSDLLQKGSSRCPLPGCQICLNPSKKSFSVPSMFDKSGFIWADWRLNCKY